MKIIINRRLASFFLLVALLFVFSGCQKKGLTLSAKGSEPGNESGLVFDQDAYPPNGWTLSMADGARRATLEGKKILINFTGSDWCVWCKKLEKEVFSTQVFLDWANENLVMVYLDFPQNIEQSDNILQQNQLMQQAMGIQGFPTLMLLDSDLTPLLQTGYREGGAESYISHLQNDRLNMAEADAQKFRDGFGDMIKEALETLEIK